MPPKIDLSPRAGAPELVDMLGRPLPDHPLSAFDLRGLGVSAPVLDELKVRVRELRDATWADMQTIDREAGNRAYTADEQRRWDASEADITALSEYLTRCDQAKPLNDPAELALRGAG